MHSIGFNNLFVIAVILCVTPPDNSEQITEEVVEKELFFIEAYLDPEKRLQTLENRVDSVPIPKLARHIGSLSDGSLVKLKAIALARKYAAIPEYAGANPGKTKPPHEIGPEQARQDHGRLDFAWEVLRETGVLRDGLRLDELVALLGEPTKITPTVVAWYYNSQMHVNPCLRYWRLDGKGKKKGQIEVVRL